MKDKYINPFTDFGFKKLFGEEANKEILMDFLNELLQLKDKITQINFLKSEHLGVTEMDRKAIFDLYCTNEKGERFIVELQKAKQKYFKDRSLYYSSFAVQEQAVRGEWDYKLGTIYTISVMDFIFDETSKNKEKLRHDVKLMEINEKSIFYDKLTFIYLEMPKFNKNLRELKTHYDKWLYLLRNLSSLEKIPKELHESIFLKLFEVAEIAKYNAKEQKAYQASLKSYRDLKNIMDTAIEEAVDKKMHEVAKHLKKSGVSYEIIAETTKLSVDEIENL